MAMKEGTRLGPYEILAPLGAGGMGEVYRARDTRLDRAVAVKVLPAHVSSKPELKERFEREARAVSSLNHPNICTLHDVGRQDGIDYLVMEMIEGETLARRLERGPLPAEQSLRIATEIASALDRAHRSGVTHRDLKPGNIMLTKAGAKLLDFGLAKLRAAGPGEGALSTLRTENRDLTGEGAILGTFQYMAPEQLEGKEADPRTDIFAFGAVLYEMLTGKRAFSGKSQASLIASILAAEPPPIASIQPMAPAALDRVVRTCLAKDPDDRWQTAHDVMLQLRWIAEGDPSGGTTAAAPRGGLRAREALAWSAAAALLVASVALAVSRSRSAPAGAEVTRLSLLPPPQSTFDSIDAPVTISPDGRHVAFGAEEAAGGTNLWVRDLDGSESHRIDGSKDPYDPFWSPDSRFIGFGKPGAGLLKVALAGGPVQKVAEMADGRGCDWNRDNVIIFTKNGASPLFRVSAGGGPVEPLTTLDTSRGETGHWRPRFLPDGRHFVFLAKHDDPKEDAIFVGSLDSKETKRVAGIDATAAPAPPGFLLYVRESVLMAQPFDFGRLSPSGDPAALANGVQYVPTWGTPGFSVSDRGVLTFQGSSRQLRRLAWFDRSGREISELGDPAEIADDPRLSADGRYAAVARLDPSTRGKDIWVIDIARGVASRLTSNPAQEADPVWSPDGSRVAFMSNRAGIGDLYTTAANGSGGEEVLLKSEEWKTPQDWSRDGRFLIYAVGGGQTGGLDLWVLPLAGERKPRPFLVSAFEESEARFSPDSKWVAYTSNETGRREVFVQPFPPDGSKRQISVGGGNSPRWRGDGKEIFYFEGRGARMAVDVRTERGFESGVPKKLFDTPLSRGSDAAADGQRFLINMPSGETEIAPATIVLNWSASLPK